MKRGEFRRGAFVAVAAAWILAAAALCQGAKPYGDKATFKLLKASGVMPWSKVVVQRILTTPKSSSFYGSIGGAKFRRKVAAKFPARAYDSELAGWVAEHLNADVGKSASKFF